jgi:hypothetical protein
MGVTLRRIAGREFMIFLLSIPGGLLDADGEVGLQDAKTGRKSKMQRRATRASVGVPIENGYAT